MEYKSKLSGVYIIDNSIARDTVEYHTGKRVEGGVNFRWHADIPGRNRHRTLKRIIERINADPDAWEIGKINLMNQQTVWYVDQADGAMLVLALNAET